VAQTTTNVMARSNRRLKQMAVALVVLMSFVVVGLNIERTSLGIGQKFTDGVSWATASSLSSELKKSKERTKWLENQVKSLQQQLRKTGDGADTTSSESGQGSTETSESESQGVGSAAQTTERTTRTKDQGGADEDQVQVWGSVHATPGFPEAMRRLTERVGRVYCAVPSSLTEAKMDQWRAILRTWGARCDVIKFFVDPSEDEHGNPVHHPDRYVRVSSIVRPGDSFVRHACAVGQPAKACCQ
jgi:hypothetical protein